MAPCTDGPTQGGGMLMVSVSANRRFWRLNQVWKAAMSVLIAAVLSGCPGTTHTVKLGYLYAPDDTGITNVMHYGGSAAVSFGGSMDMFSVEGCALFTYIHMENANQHNLPGSYCLEVGL